MILKDAIWKPLAENGAGVPAIVPKAIISHSAVDAPGPTNLYGFFNQVTVTVESHFWVPLSGRFEQFMNTVLRADANYKANGWAISIETEDDGRPDTLPWNDAQLAALLTIHVECMREHKAISHRVCPSWTESGIGYHSQYPEWSNVRGKTCPGIIRIQQWKNELVPAILKTLEEGDTFVAVTDTQARRVVKALYPVLLGREGDQGGIDFWSGILVARGLVDGVIEFVVGSADEAKGASAKLEQRIAALEAAVKVQPTAGAVNVDAVVAEIISRLEQ